MRRGVRDAFTGEFWRAALERAVRTVAQALIAVTFADKATPALLATDWRGVAAVAATAGLLSLCTSLAIGVPVVVVAEPHEDP